MDKYKDAIKKPKQWRHWCERLNMKDRFRWIRGKKKFHSEFYFKNRRFRCLLWLERFIECGYYGIYSMPTGATTSFMPKNFKEFKKLMYLMVEKSRVAESLNTTCFIDKDLNESYDKIYPIKIVGEK